MDGEDLRKYVQSELNQEVVGILKHYDTGQVSASLTITDEGCVYRVKFPHLKEKPFNF